MKFRPRGERGKSRLLADRLGGIQSRMTAGEAGKAEGVTGRPRRIGVSHHVGDIHAGGIETLNRLIVRIENLEVAVRVEAAVSREEVGTQLHGIKFLVFNGRMYLTSLKNSPSCPSAQPWL